MSFVLECPPQYDLITSVHAWIYPDVQPVPEMTGPGIFGRIYDVDGKPLSVLLSQNEAGAPIDVSYSPDESQPELRNLLKEVLGFKVDTASAIQEIENDSKLAHVAPVVNGIRPYQSPTAFEALAKTIVQQQISYKAANVLTRRLVQLLGSNSCLQDVRLFSFPFSRDVLEVGSKRLKEIGLGFKVPYIRTVCQMDVAGKLETNELRSMSYEDLVELLKPARGIGEWTIQTLCIAGLGKFDIFPYSDLGIQNLLGRLYRSGNRLTASQVRGMAQRWNDGALVLYLLMCADVLGLFPTAGRPKSVKRSQPDRSSAHDR